MQNTLHVVQGIWIVASVGLQSNEKYRTLKEL